MLVLDVEARRIVQLAVSHPPSLPPPPPPSSNSVSPAAAGTTATTTPIPAAAAAAASRTCTGGCLVVVREVVPPDDRVRYAARMAIDRDRVRIYVADNELTGVRSRLASWRGGAGSRTWGKTGRLVAYEAAPAGTPVD